MGVESQPGSGSTFWVEISLNLVADAPNEVSHPNLSTAQVLVATRHELEAESLSEYLQSWQIQPELVQNFEALIARVAESSANNQRPQLIVVDDDLLVETHPAARVDLATQTQGIHRILLANAISAVAHEEENLEIFHNIFLKPIKASQLFDSVVEAVEGRLASAARKSGSSVSGIKKTKTPASDLANLRVLLAEDHPTNRRLCELVLESFGLRADVAVNGREALRCIEKQAYDVILMDCHMPEMDGYDTTRAVREWAKSKPNFHRPFIIALTANALAGERERCLAAGMDDYLAKPFTSRQLEQVLIHSLNRSAATEAKPQIISAGGSVLFEVGRLDQLCKDLDVENVSAIVQEFLAEIPGQMERMQELLGTETWPEISRLAHSMQGIASSLGLGLMPALLRELETAAEQSSAEIVKAKIATLGPVAKDSATALESWLSAQTP